MINERDVIKYYQYFFRKKYRSKTYKFLLNNEKTRLLCENFITLFNDSFKENAGEQMLWNYILFQFQRWEGAIFKDREIGGDRILPAMILGQKAFSKFLERDQYYDYQFHTTTPFILMYDLRKSDVEQVKKKTEDTKSRKHLSDLAVHRDPNKAAFLNTEEGLMTCIEMTSLYDPKDISCTNCQYAEDCKNTLLKLYYPNIYQQQHGREDQTEQ